MCAFLGFYLKRLFLTKNDDYVNVLLLLFSKLMLHFQFTTQLYSFSTTTTILHLYLHFASTQFYKLPSMKTKLNYHLVSCLCFRFIQFLKEVWFKITHAVSFLYNKFHRTEMKSFRLRYCPKSFVLNQ